MSVAINGLPATAAPGAVLSGPGVNLVCTNVSATTAATNATCTAAAGTPAGATVSVGACVASSGSAASLPAGATLTCPLTVTMPGTAGGTNTTQTSVGIDAATSATNDNVTGNNTTSATVALIDAVTDSLTTPFATAATLNVLTNDQATGITGATPANVTVTQTVAPTAGSTFNPATGDFSVPNTAPPGVYTVSYQICTNPAVIPAACDTATATITVGTALIDAINDTAVTLPSTGGTVPNVVANDTVFGSVTPNAVIGTNVTLSATLTGAPAGVTINTTTGEITVPAGTAPGVYTVGYTICTLPATPIPTCDSATVVITTLVAPDMQVVPSTQLENPVAGVPYPPGQTITCTNASPVTAANAFCTVTDLPPGLTSTCSPATPVLSLPPGGSIVCTIGGTPTTSAPINAKVVTGADGDTIPSNNNGVILSKPATGLLVTKSASANPLKIDGKNQYYSISIAITNGPTPAPIVLNDDFGAGISTSGPVTITGGTFKPGTCAAASGSGATTLTGCTIEAGVASIVYITVPINISEAAEGPTGGNNTVIASGGGDPTCPTAANCIGFTGNIAVEYIDLGSLFIRKVVDKTNAEIGDVLTYQVTVRSTKVRGAAVVNDKLPLGFSLISKSVRVSTGGSFVAAADPVGAPGPNLAFSINIPAKNQDVVIEYKVRIGLGADRGDGVNSAQASMRNYNLQSMIAKAKVKVTGGVFTREACIVGKVYADCNGNGVQDDKESGIAGVRLYMENGTTITTDESGQYSLCGVRAVTHVLKIDSTSLPAGSKLGITSNRNMGDPNTLFVDVLAGQIHQADFRVDGCSAPSGSQKGTANPQSPVVQQGGGVQFDSSQPSSLGLTPIRPITPAKDGEK